MEQLLLERMLQQLACRGEGALLGRASGQMLDELLADTLCRHALRLSRRQSRVADSRVLGAAHRLNPNPNPNPNSNPNPNPNPNPNISTALWGRAGRQQGAELRVRPRHLPDRPVVPAIAEAWRGQPRAASTGLRRTPRKALSARVHWVRMDMAHTARARLAHPFRSATCLRSPPSMTS